MNVVFLQDGSTMLASCSDCKERIYYVSHGTWMCCGCCRKFYPTLKSNCANYYDISSGDDRYSIETWVANWMGIASVETVEVYVTY